MSLPAKPSSSRTAEAIAACRVDPAAAAVELTDVSFNYDVRPILTGITMTIPRGKIVAIMGASGSGKTTILRLIGGQLRPKSGQVRVGGLSVPDLEPEALIRDLVLMKLHAVGLRGAAHLMPAELSGGMARRVALARAIALDPMLVMYDEPFAGLDPISLGVVGQLIRRLNDVLAITSVVVTHDVYESLKIVDYLYFVSGGRIVASGTPEEVRASGDPFVRQFIDGAPDGPVPFHYPAPAYREELFADVG